MKFEMVEAEAMHQMIESDYDEEPNFIDGIELTADEYIDGALEYFSCEYSEQDTNDLGNLLWEYLHGTSTDRDKTVWEVVNGIRKGMRYCSTPLKIFTEAFWQIHVGYFNYRFYTESQVQEIMARVKDFKPHTANPAWLGECR